jgi:hypothetical protein
VARNPGWEARSTPRLRPSPRREPPEACTQRLGLWKGGRARLLTLHVVDQALAQPARRLKAGHCIPVAVNLSPSNLLDNRLPDDIAEALERHGCSVAQRVPAEPPIPADDLPRWLCERDLSPGCP